MENKKIGIIIILISVLLVIVLFYIKSGIDKAYQTQIDFYGEQCPTDPNICPHTLKSKALIPVYIAIILIVGFVSLALYIIFFEKSEKEIIKTLKEVKEKETKDEKFETLLKGLDDYEKKVLKSLREQDGIGQSTLRIRTDLSKAKLSMILTDFEKKGLIKKVKKGKINLIYIKEAI